MTEPSQLNWHNPDWQQQAHEWIRAQAQRNSIVLTGEIEQNHAYAWSTVLRIPTSAGMLFFKATAGETVYEAALTQKLADWFAESMPELIAVDVNRGWMLMRDGGEQLRASIRPTKDVMPWEPVIRRYAELQMGLAEHVDEILSLGIPDHRLYSLPTLYAELLADEASLMIDQEKGVSSAEFQQLQNLKTRFETICSDLAAFGIPESLNHGDFHDGNVLLKNGRITFFDWGDADVTHPFVSLRTFFVSMEISLQLEDWAPPTLEMLVLLDRYLEPWERLLSKERLHQAYKISRPVASIVKALAWHNSISNMDSTLREQYAWIVPDVLQEFMIYEKALSE